MARFIPKRIQRLGVSAGDRNKYIYFKTRDLTAPTSGPDFSQIFALVQGTWASVQTLGNGVIVFNGTNLDVAASHLFLFPWFEGLTTEFFITYLDDNYRIESLQDTHQDKRFWFAYCNIRGDKDDEVNHA